MKTFVSVNFILEAPDSDAEFHLVESVDIQLKDQFGNIYTKTLTPDSTVEVWATDEGDE